ncbi:hypothetical protein KAU43_09055 [candidate division WOR-3 bacterium]|nr:hypothetical protein [candidate division WOR-3 bacterium]
MKKSMLIIIFILMLNSIYGGEKQKAADAFKNNDVKKAINIMKQYSKENPEDAEAYFYLGRYLHYAQYDVGKRVYDEKISNKIINYLDKAVSITDTIGNAYYYIGVEYGMRGHYAFIENDTIKSKKEFGIGRKKGGYPDWLLEYAKNVLKSCKKNAILFTGGDAEANSIWYLQFVKHYRRDVSVFPLGLISYTPFVTFVNSGIDNYFIPIHTGLNDREIEKIHPRLYKCDSADLTISDKVKKQYNLKDDYIMKWQLKPDYVFKGKEIIMPGTDILLHILKNNKWNRPVYFTVASQPNLRGNLGDFLRTEGLCLHLLPIRKNEKIFIEPNITANLLMNKENLKDYPSVKNHNMPRCNMVLINYLNILIELYNYYNSINEYNNAEKTLIFIKDNVDIGIIKYGDKIRSYLDSLYEE